MNWLRFITHTFAGVFAFFLLTVGSIPTLTPDGATARPAVTIAYAQEDTTYTFMQNVDLPGFGGESDTVNISDQSLAEFVNTLIQITIGFAILLAIIMVIAAGAQYMLAGSVTKKSNAKDQIAKALGGLFLALSAVVILQTINPNLIELDALEKQTFEGDELNNFTEVDWNEKNPDDGYYACFFEYTATNELYCYTDINECSNSFDQAQESDDWSVDESTSCTNYVFYEGARADAEGAEACYASFKGGDPTNNSQYNVQCFSSEQDCNENRSQAQNINEIPDPETQCKAPVEFGSGNENLTYESTGKVVDPNENKLTTVTGTSTASQIAANQQCINKGDNWIQNNTGQNEECPQSTGPQSPECRVQGCDSAENTENALVYACPRGDDDYSDPCSLSERRECENCDSLTDSLSFTPGDHYRPDPRVCHDDYAVSDNVCQINNDLASKINTLESNLDIPWTLNEAWPPTIRHLSQCHAVGTCVDIALRQETRPDGTPITPYPNNPLNQDVAEHAQRVNAFIEAAENAGLTVMYEVGSDNLMDQLNDEGVPEGKIISIGVAPHFSVYRSQSDM